MEQRKKDYRHFSGNKEVAPPVIKEPKVQRNGDRLVVDGIILDPKTQPLQCQICGAIWQRLTVTIKTTDPRCATCDHDFKQLREVEVTLWHTTYAATEK